MQKDGNGLSPENELKEKPKLKKGVSKVNTSKEEKARRKDLRSNLSQISHNSCQNL